MAMITRRFRWRVAAMMSLLISIGLNQLAAVAVAESSQAIEVRITQKYLVAMCVDGKPVQARERRLRLPPGDHALAFTMRNAPRSGAPGGTAEPGVAVVTVTLEAGHRYEVETRAPAETYSRRVWIRGEWQPVVRDRTADRIVSSVTAWTDAGCDD